jgi:hypothetical protein
MGYAELYLHNKGEMIVTKNNYSLKSEWKELCNKYLKKFCDKHEYIYEADCWVASDPGTIANIGDMFVSMENIRYDLDNDIPEEYFEKWYWKALEVYELVGEKFMNYENFCKGCPDYWTEDKLESIRKAKQRVIDARDALEREINEHKSQF